MFNLYSKSVLKDTPNWLEIETESKRGESIERNAYLQTFAACQTHTQTRIYNYYEKRGCV